MKSIFLIGIAVFLCDDYMDLLADRSTLSVSLSTKRERLFTSLFFTAQEVALASNTTYQNERKSFLLHEGKCWIQKCYLKAAIFLIYKCFPYIDCGVVDDLMHAHSLLLYGSEHRSRSDDLYQYEGIPTILYGV